MLSSTKTNKTGQVQQLGQNLQELNLGGAATTISALDPLVVEATSSFREGTKFVSDPVASCVAQKMCCTGAAQEEAKKEIETTRRAAAAIFNQSGSAAPKKEVPAEVPTTVEGDDWFTDAFNQLEANGGTSSDEESGSATQSVTSKDRKTSYQRGSI